MAQSQLLAILDLFDADTPVWTVEAIAREKALSLRTAYRLVRELTQAGFLDPSAGAGYVLGPAFIRFDRTIRRSDPLIAIAGPNMSRLLERTTEAAAVILCRRYKDCIMCVDQIEGVEGRQLVSYERGVAMSLFRGAPAKIILAFMPERNLRSLYLRNEKDVRDAGNEDWPAFKAMLKSIRQAGYATTESEIGPGRLGVAAPILREGQVIASISLVTRGRGVKGQPPPFAEEVMSAAEKISKAIAGQDAITPRS
jgi:DNA-binding IclR family transcriptional regulator